MSHRPLAEPNVETFRVWGKSRPDFSRSENMQSFAAGPGASQWSLLKAHMICLNKS